MEGGTAKHINNIWVGLCLTGSVQSHTVKRAKTRQFLSLLWGFASSLLLAKLDLEKNLLSVSSYLTVSMRWHQWDQTKWIKLILNDGRHKVCAHMHNTHFRTWSNINKLHRKPPEIVSHLLSLRVEKSHKFWQAWKTLYLQISYLKDLVENLAQFFFFSPKNHRHREAAVQTAVQTDPVLSSNSASHCQPAPTHRDHNNRAANLSISTEYSPLETSEKQTWVYRCSEITSYL